jgi:hypothetical protein
MYFGSFSKKQHIPKQSLTVYLKTKSLFFDSPISSLIFYEVFKFKLIMNLLYIF